MTVRSVWYIASKMPAYLLIKKSCTMTEETEVAHAQYGVIHMTPVRYDENRRERGGRRAYESEQRG